MEDEKIVALYWARDPDAIRHTAEKYGGLCGRIAGSLLGDARDAEECVSDTYQRTWDSVPPSRPVQLAAYLGRIVRNLCLSRYRAGRAQKRYGGMEQMLEELEECLPGRESVEQELEAKELSAFLDRWLGTLGNEDRALFVRRYWYGDSVSALAKERGKTVNQVSLRLYRMRQGLREQLERRED